MHVFGGRQLGPMLPR